MADLYQRESAKKDVTEENQMPLFNYSDLEYDLPISGIVHAGHKEDNDIGLHFENTSDLVLSPDRDINKQYEECL